MLCSTNKIVMHFLAFDVLPVCILKRLLKNIIKFTSSFQTY